MLWLAWKCARVSQTSRCSCVPLTSFTNQGEMVGRFNHRTLCSASKALAALKRLFRTTNCCNYFCLVCLTEDRCRHLRHFEGVPTCTLNRSDFRRAFGGERAAVLCLPGWGAQLQGMGAGPGVSPPPGDGHRGNLQD